MMVDISYTVVSSTLRGVIGMKDVNDGWHMENFYYRQINHYRNIIIWGDIHIFYPYYIYPYDGWYIIYSSINHHKL